MILGKLFTYIIALFIIIFFSYGNWTSVVWNNFSQTVYLTSGFFDFKDSLLILVIAFCRW